MTGTAENHDADDAGRNEAEDVAETSSAESDALADGAEVEDFEARAQENWDRYLRAAAETENVRKRAQRDIENARKFALESFSRDLLDVRDSLEMGLAAAESADAAALREGSEATLKLLGSVMERSGVVQVDPLGEPFDPELHEAMTLQPSADAEPDTVLIVVQKGYTLNGRLLRPARVVVSAPMPEKD